MAAADLDSKIRIDGDDVWIKTTPGRLRAFLSVHFGFGQKTPQSVGAPQNFLDLLKAAEAKLAK